MKTHVLLVAVSIVLLCFVSTVSAALISVDIDGASSAVSSPGTMTGVAALGSTGDQWNGYAVYTTSLSAPVDPDVSGYLVDSTGSAKSVKFDVGMTASDTCAPANQAGNLLLDDYVFFGPTQPTVNFSFQGLTAGNAYDLLLYGEAGAQSTSIYPTTFTVGGVGKSLNNAAAFDGSYVEDRDYVSFSGVVADGSGMISGTVTSPTDFYFIFNGVQITGDFAEAPEPSTCALLMVGLTGLLAYAWRKRK